MYNKEMQTMSKGQIPYLPTPSMCLQRYTRLSAWRTTFLPLTAAKPRHDWAGDAPRLHPQAVRHENNGEG